MGGGDLGHNSAAELPDGSLIGVAPVKKHHIITAGHQIVDLSRAQVHASADYPVRAHLDLIGRPERHEFVAYLDRKPWEIGNGPPRGWAVRAAHRRRRFLKPTTLAPLDVLGQPRKRPVLLGALDVLFAGVQLPAHRAVDPVRGNDDPPAQSQTIAQLALPQPHGLGIVHGDEQVIQKNLGNAHAPMIGRLLPDPRPPLRPPRFPFAQPRESRWLPAP